MSTLFDYALSMVSRSSEDDTKAFARIIFLMTDDEPFRNDEYVRAKDGSFINWEWLVHEGLAFLVQSELQASRTGERVASLCNVLKVLEEACDSSVTFEKFIPWRQFTPDMKRWFFDELLDRVSVICSVSDLVDLRKSESAKAHVSALEPRSPFTEA
jgi:hypothetical protein